jgi:tRNA-uridine 2-sulfurtransferase
LQQFLIMKRVVVGLSGGVDSSVAALLLKEQGYDVIGLFMINWHDKTGTLSGDCPWKDDLLFAELVARKLDIAFHSVDFSEQYRKRVVDYMFAEYEHGRTPNPDILCNREIKFDLFLDKALELGADYIATGHYCRKEEIIQDGKAIYRLLAGMDPNKEQSYFLCQLSQQQIAKVLFPIGHLYKPELRKIAEKAGLATANRKDSQGICFVGKVDLPGFLQQKLEPKEGQIIEIPPDSEIFSKKIPNGVENMALPFKYSPEAGHIIGKHKGAHFYTIGQNRGLNIGGRPMPSFVIATDVLKNIIYTGLGDQHPGLFRKALYIKNEEIHWIRQDYILLEGTSAKYKVRIRYRQELQDAILMQKSDGLFIQFENAQRGITPGQFAAWYQEDELIGSGVINA